jgi:hypothetical protein
VVYLSDRARNRWRLASALLCSLGLVCLFYGFAVPAVSQNDDVPIPVKTGAVVPLPPERLLDGTLAVYGHPTTQPAPTADQLGCEIRKDGEPLTGALSAVLALPLDRLVVDGVALTPLLAVPNPAPDRTISCTGPYAATSQPLYLMRSGGQRDELPMAAFSFAALAIVMGIAGVIVLRPIE